MIPHTLCRSRRENPNWPRFGPMARRPAAPPPRARLRTESRASGRRGAGAPPSGARQPDCRGARRRASAADREPERAPPDVAGPGPAVRGAPGRRMNVLFVTGRLNIAGGVYIAAKMAEVLAATGRHDVALAVWDWKSVTGASWFARPESVPVVPFESAADRRWDVVFGTWWETLLVLPQVPALTYAHFMP